MGTILIPELSKKNPYKIDKHRYYELKHFCLQYNHWKDMVEMYHEMANTSYNVIFVSSKPATNQASKTERTALECAAYDSLIDLVDRVAEETDPELGNYILIGVTEGLPYDILKLRYNIPCCRDTYYKLYRRFFWILDKVRE
jgi:hypothetical protein